MKLFYENTYSIIWVAHVLICTASGANMITQSNRY